jgi:hypothetical protein
VIVVILENESYQAACKLPCISGLVAANASFAECYAIANPSQPNYFALWSGSLEGQINDNCPPPGAPFSSENLGHACETAGLSWRSYAENLPAPGSTVCTASPAPTGFLYVRKHAPWVSYSNLNHANEQPYSQLAADIAALSLPSLAFVIPNDCHNGHDCPPDTVNAWLTREMPQMLSAVGPAGLVALTFDEDDSFSGNRILTVLAGLQVRPGFVSHRFVNHYSLLRTICDGLRIVPFGAAAAESAITDIWPSVTGVGDPPGGVLSAIKVGVGRPNPFTGITSVALSLPAPTVVSAEVFDLAGRRVRRLAPATLSGAAEIPWDGTADDGSRVRPGVYLLRVRAAGAVFARRVVHLR